MRPITQILSVFLFALLTSVGMAQFTTPHFNDWPSEVNFQNWSFDTVPKGVVDMSAGSFNKTGGQDIPGFARWTTYERPDADGLGGKTVVTVRQYNGGSFQIHVGMFAPGDGGSPTVSANYSGPSLTNLSREMYGWEGLYNTAPPVAFDPAVFVNGLSPDGLSLVGGSATGGGSGGGGGGSVIVEQAAQLNIGLIFQDGQWTPSNN